jgi:hypothetical protein
MQVAHAVVMQYKHYYYPFYRKIVFVKEKKERGNHLNSFFSMQV